MNSIFISYRRTDTEAMAGRIHDRLQGYFGKGEVFQDVESLHMGQKFPTAIADTIRGSACALILIGPQWLTAKDEQGKRRLDDPEDWVRKEVALALKSAPNTTVIPVLVQGARMPTADQLPDDLKDLALINAARVRGDHDFTRDMDELIEELKGQPGFANLRRIAAAQRAPQAPAPQPMYSPPPVVPHATGYAGPPVATGVARRWWLIPVVIVGPVALCAALGYFASMFNSNGQFTGASLQGGARPSQVTNAQLFTKVDAAMQTCASAATVTPANCPQSDPNVYGANDIVWTLHGDPTSGATVRYTGSLSNGQFTVNGAYVFTLEYFDSGLGSQLKVMTGYYTASIHWNGSALSAANLASADSGPNVPRPAQATDKAAIAAASAYFSAHRQCPTFSACPLMPPYSHQGEYDTTNTVYTFRGDQFATARVTYQTTGVMLITGNYAGHITCQVAPINQPCDNDIGGNFQFSLTMDSGALRVIDITYTNTSG